MEDKINLNSIIDCYAEQFNTPIIDFHDFCIYIKKYAEDNLENNPDLVRYLGDTASILTIELEELSKKHIATIIFLAKKKTIVYLTFLANYFYGKYNEILRNSSNPYPTPDNLPKKVPFDIIEKKKASEYISFLIDKDAKEKIEEETEPEIPVLYIIKFSKSVPPMLLPSTVSIETLMTTAQQKIRNVLRKEESHDYYLKKLKNTNPGRGLSIRNFYAKFVDNVEFQYGNFTDDETYYIWNQILYYIRIELENIEEKNIEDINTLQACFILEIETVYIKEKMRLKQQKEEAFAYLETCMAKSPYYFSMSQILKFQDDNGNLLYGKYTEEDLQEYLAEKTSEEDPDKLPPILILKVSSGKAFYIYKQYIEKVIIKFCNEVYVSIERQLEDSWYESLINFKKLPEMINQEMFENKLHEMVAENSPILNSILTAQFIPLLVSEQKATSELFKNGCMPSYSELLMLSNEKIYLHAKNRLPFYYNIKIVYYIMKFFSRFFSKLKSSTKTDISKQVIKDPPEEEIIGQPVKEENIFQKADEITKELIPEGSDIDKELDKLINQWNRMLSKVAHDKLVSDVNDFIKDYLRRVTQTLSVMTFTRQIAEDLAGNIANTPVMNKISDKKALKAYATLYILKLVSNH